MSVVVGLDQDLVVVGLEQDLVSVVVGLEQDLVVGLEQGLEHDYRHCRCCQ